MWHKPCRTFHPWCLCNKTRCLFCLSLLHALPMMTSSNGNIFRVTGPLCGEFTGHRWIPRTKASDAENINAPRHWPLWGNSPVTGDLPASKVRFITIVLWQLSAKSHYNVAIKDTYKQWVLCAKPRKTTPDGNCDGLIRPSCESRTKNTQSSKTKQTKQNTINKQASNK